MFEKLSVFYYNEGLKLAKEDQLAPAIQKLTKATGYNNDNTDAWNLAGLCYYRTGKYKMAEYCWDYSLSKSKENNLALEYLSKLKELLNETEEYFSQVDSFCRQRKYGQAAQILDERICSEFDMSSNLLNFLGLLWVMDGKVGKAAKCWINVLSIDKTNEDAPRYLVNLENRLSFKLFKWKERLFKKE